jgi:hypothetical protein
MTESDYTRQLIRALRQRLPKAVTFKHADMFTMGVPDFSTTLSRCTNWFECKLIDARQVEKLHPLVGAHVIVKPRRDVPAIQWETLRRLGRGHLIVYTDHGHAVTHVKGLRESITMMRLRLVPLVDLVNHVVTIAEQGERYGEDQEW